MEDPSAFTSQNNGVLKGRDGCRVPLPWVSADADGSFGFSPADASEKPHLPQPAWFADFSADVEADDADSMLSLYRAALKLRHEFQTNDLSLEWLEQDKESGLTDGADGNPGGIIAYKRANGWANLTNFSATPAELPAGEVVLASGELTADGKLPQDTSVWIKLD